MKILSIMILALLVPAAQGADRLVRLHGLTDCTVESLMAEGYDVASASVSGGYVDVLVDERDIHTLDGKASAIRLLPVEWGRLLDGNLDSMGYYYDPDECFTFWCNLAASCSDLVDTPMTIGQSFEDRDIYMIRMTSSSGPATKPTIMFTSLTHAREPGGLSSNIDFAMWLADEYGSDTMATFILDNAQVLFVPIVNPDGYWENMPGGGMQRKNMNFSVPVASSGIDLNRNYGYMWGYDNIGSSPNPYDECYRGSAAFSEDESQVMRDFHNSMDPIGIFNFHTYGGDLLYPWGYTSTPCPDVTTFQGWGALLTSQCGYIYGTCLQCLGYPANGDANDWAYGDPSHGFCMGFTPEVGYSGFWGGQNDSTIIAGDCEDTRFMCKIFCMLLLESVGVGGEQGAGIQGDLAITGISPNPAGSVLGLTAVLPAGPVEITVFDLAGRQVATMDTGGTQPGENLITWAVPPGLGDGVYLVRAVSGGSEALSRFTLIRGR
jgi:hypothetical protein